MSQGRRYTDKEIAEIFSRATKDLEASRNSMLSGEGLSLEELKEIGRESGIPAYAMEEGVEESSEKFMGLKIGTGHTLQLPRRLTEEEWEELVVDLRKTFNARGKISVNGGFRQWTNGNLQFLLEPDGDGSRLVMKTKKGNAQQLLAVGSVYAFLGVFGAIVSYMAGKLDGPLSIIAFLIFLIGLGMFVVPRFSVPRWAAERRNQMQDVGARLLTRINAEEQISSNEVSPALNVDMEAFSETEKEKVPLPQNRQRH